MGSRTNDTGLFRFIGILKNETEVHGTVRGAASACSVGTGPVPKLSAFTWTSVSYLFANLAMFPSIPKMKLRQQCSPNFLRAIVSRRASFLS